MKEDDIVGEELTFLNELVKARKRAGLTKEDVAKDMDTKLLVLTRIEHGGWGPNQSPSINLLRKYAKAVGCRLKISLEPI